MKPTIRFGLFITICNLTLLLAEAPDEVVQKMLKSDGISEVRFQKAQLSDVLSFLGQASEQLLEKHPGKKLNIEVTDPPPLDTITFEARNVSIGQLLVWVAELAGAQLSLKGNTIRFTDGDPPPPRGILFKELPANHPVYIQATQQEITVPELKEAEVKFIISASRSGQNESSNVANRLVLLLPEGTTLPKISMKETTLSFRDFLLLLETETQSMIHLEGEHLVIRKSD